MKKIYFTVGLLLLFLWVLLPEGLVAQEVITIKGTVTDASSGLPILGVSVIQKGKSSGTATNSEGNYTIKVDNKNSILVFSSVGYRSSERNAANSTIVDIGLEADVISLEEVVIGYGTQKKENLTGAVSIVTAKELEDRTASNLSQLLQGSVPNMGISFSSGRPGIGGKFNIRGINSISSSASPLILIDGIEGSIDRVNAADVASVTVLKDASAAAVYGARASYGVILVTTKKGAKGQTTVNYSGKYAVGAPTTSTNFETRGFYSAGINDLFYAKYAGTNYTNYTDDDYYQLWIRRNDKTEHPDRPWVVTDNREGRETYVYYANTDWYDYLYNDKRPTHEQNISINGGSEKVSYFLSGNFFDQKGVFRINPDKYTRYNLRSKVSIEVNDWLEISNNIGYFKSTYKFPGQGAVENNFNVTNLHGLASFVPRNPDGTLVFLNSMSNTAGIMDGVSAILSYDGHRNEDMIQEFSPSFEVLLKPIKDIDIRANYSFINYNYQAMNRSVNVPYSKYPGEVNYINTGRGLDQLYEAQYNQWYKAFNAYGTYEKTFNERHNLKLMVGYNYETRYLKDLSMSRQDLLSDLLDDFNLAKGDVMNIGGGKNEYAILGTFYRVNYDYKGRYLFEAAGRYDGTSRFRRGNRFGFFPSFSAGWRLDEEQFFQPLKSTIDMFKIRASYGSLGNQQVGYYDYIQTINNDAAAAFNYSFGDGIKASSVSESAPNASDLTWETVSTANLGLDMLFFQQRLSVTGDLYRRETKNMLTAGKTLLSVYGANAPRQNSADLQTDGWEASIAWTDQFQIMEKPFRYNISFGVGDNVSKVTRFDNPTKSLGDYYKGQKLGQVWGYKVDGYFLTDEEAANYDVNQTAVNSIINTSAQDRGLRAGDLKFVDLDNDHKISLGANTADDPGDRRVIGNSLPRYNFNSNLGASWNGLDLNVFIQGIGRQHWYPGIDALAFWGPYSRPYITYIPDDFLSKVWSEDNPNAYFPRPRGYISLNPNNRSLGVANTKYLQDLAYIRVKNITFGYTFPKRWLERVKLDRVRIYFSGENLFTFTKLENDFIDPEQASAENTLRVSTSNAKTYPWGKTYSFGLDISL